MRIDGRSRVRMWPICEMPLREHGRFAGDDLMACLEERPLQVRVVHHPSITLERRTLTRDERVIGPPEILCLHADRLRLRLGL